MTVRELIQPEAETAKLQVSGEVQRHLSFDRNVPTTNSTTHLTTVERFRFGRRPWHTACILVP